MTHASWLNAYRQIPVLQAQEDARAAQVALYPHVTDEGRQSLWGMWMERASVAVQRAGQAAEDVVEGGVMTMRQFRGWLKRHGINPD